MNSLPSASPAASVAPWKQRFRAPTIPWTALAKAAPTRGLAASNRSGAHQLYAWHVPSGHLTQLTDRPTGVVDGVLSPDGRYVYYLNDLGDNEIGHFVRIPFEGGTPQDITPDLAPYSSFGMSVSLAGNCLAFQLVNADGFHLCCIDIGGGGALGAPRMLYRCATFTLAPIVSNQGEIAVLASSERTGKMDYSLLAFDTQSGALIGELWDGPDTSMEATAFSPVAGDVRVLATTNRSGVNRALLWNPRTGERTELLLDELEGEIHPLDWSVDGRRLLLGHVSQAAEQLYVYDLATTALSRVRHPSGTFSGAYFGGDDEILANWQDSTHPPHVIALGDTAGGQIRTVLATGAVPPGHAWTSIAFPSSDGQTIQGWLGVPDGTGPFPTILETHGGPSVVQRNEFSPASQAWLDRGFAYLTINYRGSITFGRDFEQQIWGDLGHWEVEDMVAARDWLVGQGIARADQVLLTGWSYGGYLTLQALGTRPDLWAGGMAGIAIADWTVQYEDEADTLRGYQAALFGGTPEDKPEQYAASSPITYAKNVAAPVLIIQGRNDTRTPPRPIRMYEETMRALGKPIEVHWFDAGHPGALAQVELSIEHQEVMHRFAERIIGGEHPT